MGFKKTGLTTTIGVVQPPKEGADKQSVKQTKPEPQQTQQGGNQK